MTKNTCFSAHSIDLTSKNVTKTSLNFNTEVSIVNTPAYIEWVHGSGVSPEITALNVQPLYSPNEIKQKLAWKRYNHTEGWWVDNIDLRTGQKSPFGQFKPAKPFIFPGKDGKEDEEAKYLSSKLGYDAIALQTPDPDYYAKIVANPSITIAIIEGVKKTASALTCGITALALLGVEMGLTSSAKGTRKRELVPNLDIVAVPGRVFIFGFDMDMSTKSGVRIALRTLARALIARGCIVRVARWDEQYKGIDDLKVACGEEAVKTAIANAEPFEAWDKRWKVIENAELARKMLSCSYEPIVRVNQRYLNPTVLPTLNPGEILAISSAVGTGKTEVLKSVVATHRANYPDSWVFFIGYRNSLLLQTGQRLGLPHIQELEREYPGHINFALGERKAALLCLDSIFKIPWNLLPPNSLLIFDEAEATANHGLGGGTLGDRQNEALPLLEKICQQNLGNGGNLVLAEDSLTDIGLNFYKELTGSIYPIHLVQNDWKPQRTATLSNSDESGFCEKIQTELNAGKKIALLTDSQTFGEKVEHFFVGVKSFRLDSKTAETLDAKAFQADPNGYLKEHQPNLVTLSPTAESGVSIDLTGYHVRANLTSGDTRRQFQLLNRVRNPESIDILTKDRGILSDNDWKTDPRHLIRQWAISMRHTTILSQVEADLQAQDWSPEAQASLVTLEATLQGTDKSSLFWTRHYANFKARENVLKQGMGLNLEGYLCDRGFAVERVEYPTNKAIKTQLKLGKEVIECNTATKLYEAAGGQAESVALSILSSGSATYEQRINAQKSLLQKRLPGADLSEEFLLKAIVQKRGKGFKDTQTLWTCQHPEIAKKLDRSQIKGQLVKGLVFPWKLSHHTQKADLFRQLGLQAFVDLADSGVEFKDGDAIVQTFREKALNNSAACWRVFQLNFNSGQSGIHMLSRMMKRLGLKLKSPRRVGGKGKQERVRIVVSAFPSAYRAEIFKALNRKWADDLGSVVTISNKGISLLEMVTTEPDPPPKEGAWGVGDVVLFALDGSECKIQRVEGDRFRVKRVGPWENTVSFEVSACDLRVIA